jgi:hypothetical protein
LQPNVPDADPRAVNQDWFQECPLENMRVAGIDPGAIDFVTGVVSGDSKEQFSLDWVSHLSFI